MLLGLVFLNKYDLIMVYMKLKQLLKKLFRKESLPYSKVSDDTREIPLPTKDNPLLGKWVYLGELYAPTIVFYEDVCRFIVFSSEELCYVYYEFQYITKDDTLTFYRNGFPQKEFNYEIIGNILLCGKYSYFRDGEIPAFENNYTSRFDGYYKNDTNEYFRFCKKGRLEVIREDNLQYNYYYLASKDKLYAMFLDGDSLAYLNTKYSFDDNKLELNDFTLTPITKEEYLSRQADDVKLYNSRYCFLVLVDGVPVIDEPFMDSYINIDYDKNEIHGTTIKETYTATLSQGMTWYLDNDGFWIPNKDGKWLLPLIDDEDMEEVSNYPYTKQWDGF